MIDNKINSVLLVDDNRATNFYNKHLFQQMGFDGTISMVENGSQALKFIDQAEIPDIIFLDINMPVMDGIEFLIEAQKNDSFKNSDAMVLIMMGVELTQDRLDIINATRKVGYVHGKMLTREAVTSAINDYNNKSSQDRMNKLYQI